MAETATCDVCGADLLTADLRYVARIEVFAAYDVMELSRADLEKDHGDEIKKLLEEINGKSAGELLDGVYRRFEFDLCQRCQREYLKDPLGLGVRRVKAASYEEAT